MIAANRPIDEASVEAIGDLFVECIAAPGFTTGARERLSGRQNLRLLSMPDSEIEPPFEFRTVIRGILRQTVDRGDPRGTRWRVVSERQPTEHEWRSLQFAWVACQHVRSNAIVIAKGEVTVGIGGGQPSRVESVRIATTRAGERARGAVLASDAFFPFPDAVLEAAQAGITAIAQPGGSIRDEQAIQTANENRLAMVFTGVRHFRH